MVIPTKAARKRARCVAWLTGQCHAGAECTCLPALLSPSEPQSVATMEVQSAPETTGTEPLIGHEC